ncbi:hypothetical protein MFFC18_04600 [Mariniblastus fucicola]|uniref:Uncharacterized protein n=1 Tax=Mariniblastus fucicola TaxID=980251 RepID=A0A5B9P6Q6_9BACT|nr:hypothetical protein MFFC18_04600 [Mariniblastus fucicola]
MWLSPADVNQEDWSKKCECIPGLGSSGSIHFESAFAIPIAHKKAKVSIKTFASKISVAAAPIYSGTKLFLTVS